MYKIIFLIGIIIPFGLTAQISHDSIDTRIQLDGLFVLRTEFDWNSIKSNGEFRNDRSRLRVRVHIGLKKQLNKNFQVGLGVRTGSLNNQQSPFITLGGSKSEFGLFPIGLEKAFVRYESPVFLFLAGKFKYPFFKQNDLMWSGNVLPEGLAIINTIDLGKFKLSPGIGYFIFKSSGRGFLKNSYVATGQVRGDMNITPRLKLETNIGFLYFKNLPNHPDGLETFFMDYKIGTVSLKLSSNTIEKLSFGIDAYHNFANYAKYPQVDFRLKDQKTGVVFNFKYGELKQTNDWIFQVYLASIEQHAIVPYLAQSDWGRWTYEGSNAARLSNFQGAELRLGYALAENIHLFAKYYNIRSKVRTGDFHETGERFRVDLSVKF